MDVVHLDDLAEPRFPAEAREMLDAMAAMGDDVVLEPEALTAAASEQAGGLTDFGDPAFREPLSVLCGALAGAGLSPAGRTALFAQYTRLLANRLLLEDLLARHPEIHDVPLERPIVIAGLPRSGTTHLHNLIAAAPGIRSLPYWEAVEPIAPPGEEGTAPRIARTEAALNFVHTAMPHFKRMHDITPTHAHEEIDLLALSFSSVHFETQVLVPAYRDWYRATDQTAAYEYLRTALKALTWLRGGGRWVLKSPQHLEQLGPLTSVFPDATVVVTHRDPAAVTVSMATMVCYALRMSTYPIDPHAVGRYWAARAEDLLNACLRDRDLLPAGRAVDVRFDDFMADDVATVERVFALAGQPFTPEVRKALEAFMTGNRRNRHGRVDYRAADLGLDPAERRAALAAYADRFGV